MAHRVAYTCIQQVEACMEHMVAYVALEEKDMQCRVECAYCGLAGMMHFCLAVAYWCLLAFPALGVPVVCHQVRQVLITVCHFHLSVFSCVP